MKFILGILFITGTTFLYSQETIEINFCSEFTGNKHSNQIQLSLIQNGDTIPIPYLGNNMYLTKPLFYIANKADSTIVILLENCKYYYLLDFYKEDFEKKSLTICVEKKVNRLGQVKWNYTNYYGRNLAGFTTRIKK